MCDGPPSMKKRMHDLAFGTNEGPAGDAGFA